MNKGCDNSKWEKLYNSVTHRLKELEKKNIELKTMNNILTEEKKQWEQQKVLQGQIISHQLLNSDNVVRQLQDEILNLKSELKELKELEE